ncbi:MAG: methyltransferase domain-containing protein [Chloroflexi bacterium]|nr:methyltransferase domain-containing protein [Chloroflexota bacterium]
MTTPNARQPAAPLQTQSWAPGTADRTLLRTAEKQAAFLLSYLGPGMRLLDCGCGPGTITVGLAGAVAPGEVIGIDIGARQIELAQTHAAQRGVHNVRFQVADVLKLPFENSSFDAVYANGLLMWFDDPLAALCAMRRVLRPGGLVGVRDPDGQSTVLNPAAAVAFDRQFEWAKVHVYGGRDPRTGRRNRGLLRQAGFARCEGFADVEYAGAPDSVGQFAATQVQGQLGRIQANLGDRATLERFAQEIRDWAESPDAFWCMTHCSAIGWKEG